MCASHSAFPLVNSTSWTVDLNNLTLSKGSSPFDIEITYVLVVVQEDLIFLYHKRKDWTLLPKKTI